MAFQHVLQDSIRLSDHQWSYNVPNLPHPSMLNFQQMIKSISLISNGPRQQILLKTQNADRNRALISDPFDRFIVLSFTAFRPQTRPAVIEDHQSDSDSQPSNMRECSEYIVKFLRFGIILNSIHYNFYGHSNSQLKSRSCYMYAGSKEDISRKVDSLGDFRKMKTVGKKSKRIGLLFSTAQVATILDSNFCKDIPDVETKDYIYTDGCGLISQKFAQELAYKLGIKFRNCRYAPSVFQIRYLGYKGVVMLDPSMKDGTRVKFRKSMKKFSGGNDFSFSVVDYSKPYGFGYLNDEVVLLLHALGVQDAVLVQKQAEYFKFLASAVNDPRLGFQFLSYTNNLEQAEKLLLEGIESIKPTIRRLANAEYSKMLNKREEQRCRIMVEKSRLLFGVCDAWSVLKEGECAVKITIDGQPKALHGMEILVTRNPCLHPGDLQKFKVVAKDELAHLIDCIVFPTCGKRPAADLMSGGDLDGDTFFVCWDPDLIPQKISEPALYPGGKEEVTFRPITDDDRLVYFAKYMNASLGRVKNLFLDWARLKGPMSPECQELNRLFSMSVDGNHISVPERLESPPSRTSDTPPFIIDTLHNAAKALIQAHENEGNSYDGYDFDAMQLLMCRDDNAMSEFEVISLVHRWCRKNGANLVDFLHSFDINILTAEEKAWVLNHIPISFESSSFILNSLCQSKLIQESELRQFKLNYPGLRWKCVYDSSTERLALFLDVLFRTLELFHRKLVVIRVDERLTLAVYIPQKIERRQECKVDNRVRVFAFPHSQGDRTSHKIVRPTKNNYRLYCDMGVLQLFEGRRRNSWIYICRSAFNEEGYRNINNEGDRRRARQITIKTGVNFDCRASIALDKFSRGLQKQIGRVNRNGILGAEIYVISNKDVKSMRNLDLWLDYVDTEEIIPIFEKNAREYIIPEMANADWSAEADYLIQIAKQRNFAAFKALESESQYNDVFCWLVERNETELLLHAFNYLLLEFRTSEPGFQIKSSVILQIMVELLTRAPFLSATFGRIDSWTGFHAEDHEVLTRLGPMILRAHILSANQMQGFIVEPFKRVMSQIESMTLNEFADLVELISLTVCSPEVALDLLLECLEPESIRILYGHSALVYHFVRSLLGIALDHIDEAAQSQTLRKELLDLKLSPVNAQGYQVVECRLRIDAPADPLVATDHIRLITASPPKNSIVSQPYTIDALVESIQGGSAKFRCFHPLPSFVEQCSWELQNCGSFVTSRTMFNAVRTLATGSGDCCGIREQILGMQAGLPSLSNTMYTANKSLNGRQNEAVEISLSNSLTCLWGPPGTGKTYTIVEIIKQLQVSDAKRRILVTAPTHNAVDNVMRKYVVEVANGETLSDASHMAVRVSTDIRKVADDLRKYTCDAMAGKDINLNHSAYRKAQDRIKNCRLVFTTCIGAGLGLLRSESFDTVIVDEASQQTEPASLVPLVKGCRKAILVGDHVQLGATIQQHAILQQFDISLFERLYKLQNVPQVEPTTGSMIKNSSVARVMLNTQYRMHESICRFSSDQFYESKLGTGALSNTRPLPLSEFPWPHITSRDLKKAPSSNENLARMIFIECAAGEDIGRKSKRNSGQAELCYEVCRMLCTQVLSVAVPLKDSVAPRVEEQSIAVLTPYSSQVQLLKGRLSQFTNAEVSSIDGFQGREADIVIFVTVRCNVHYEIGFLKDLRRMNVALTRARSAVIVIGNRATLTMGSADMESTLVWKKLLETLVEAKIEVPKRSK